jgi:hypothetical protein
MWLGALGSIYHAMGNIERSFHCYEQAYAGAVKIGSVRDEAQFLSELGDLLAEQSDNERAIECYRKALQISRQIGDRAATGLLWGKLGGAYRQLGNSLRAIDHCIQGLIMARDVENVAGEVRILESLGYAYQGIQDHSRALDYYQQAMDLAEQTNDVGSEISIRIGLGKLFASEGNRHEAIKQMAHSIELFERLRAGWRALHERMTFFGRRPDLYANMVILLEEDRDKHREALDYVERSKSRGYVEQLAQTSISSPDVAEEDKLLLEPLLEEIKIVTARLRQNQASLMGTPIEVKPDVSQQVAADQDLLSSLLRQIEALRPAPKEDLSRTPQEYVALREGLPSRFEEVQQCLQNV